MNLKQAVLILALMMIPLEAACGQPKPFLFGFAVEGLPRDPALVDRLKTETGLEPRIINFFLQWPSDPGQGEFPLESCRALASRNALPCLTWEPMFIENGEEKAVPAKEILSGRWDGYIARFASAAAEWGGECLIRFGHEMNIARYHWGGTQKDYGPDSPALYAAMFRHVREIFKRQGATNAKFAFCPNVESLPSPFFPPIAEWNGIEAYYPGEDYVDAVGLDGYNWGLTQTREKHGWDSSWREFADIFGPARQVLNKLAPNKPLYIFETASAQAGGDKGEWIARMLDTAESWNAAGVVWFQVNKEVDWRIQSGTPLEKLKEIRGRVD